MSRRIVGTLTLALLAAGSADAANLRLPHSGYLLDSNDQPVQSAGVLMAFRIVDRATPDVAEVTVWSASCTVPVSAGYFAVMLGDGTCGSALTSAAFPFDVARWLDITVGSTTLAPRLRLEALPNAGYAADAGSVGGQTLAQLDARYLRVQAGTPGAQAGGVAVNGVVAAGSFQGSGAGLTALDAGQLATGTVPDARLSSNVAMLSGGVLPAGVLPNIPDARLSANVAMLSGGVLPASLLPPIPDTKLSANVPLLSGGLLATSVLPGIPDTKLSANVPLLSGGVLSAGVLPSTVVLTTGNQSIGGNKTFTGTTTLSGDLDLSTNRLLNARVQPVGAAPAACDGTSATVGRMYFDTALNAMRVCRDTGWVSLLDQSAPNSGQLATYTSTTRPTGVSAGYMIFNTTNKNVEVWNGSAWVRVGGGTGGIDATGGTVTTVGNYKVHTFTTSGTFTVNAADAGAQVEVLVVGGGGGGGVWVAGGGGGGGVVYATNVPVSAGSTSVTVGLGGAGQSTAPSSGGTQASYGLRGGDSAFGTGLIARGGGGGPGYNANPAATGEFVFVDGGCGGGGRQGGNGPEGRPSRTYASVATVGSAQIFGHRGGVQGGNYGGGGGGAGTPGSSGNVDGKGGDGIFFNMDGNATYYGAGGGGGTTTGTSAGGLGGGGTGGINNGTNGTGYGSGGGSGGSNAYIGYSGGNGSAGIVIVRYLTKTLTVQAFTSVGTTSWTVPANVTTVSVLVVGGGGGGAGSGGSGSGPRGGGGAGGFVWTPNYAVTPNQSITVSVGGGGAGGAAGAENNAGSGSNSVFGTISALGGGGGGSHNASTLQGAGGGSGGGASYVANAAAFNAGTTNQGYRGGTTQWYGNQGASGGGGAGGSGYDTRQAKEPSGADKGSDTGGDGGEGRISSLSGNVAWYAGGGGAGGYPSGSGTWGVGGSGVGGNGASTGNAQQGLAGTGSGGGAGGAGAGGAAGGSGVVIVAY